MKIAVVHDWLYVNGGAERVLREILDVYKGADVYSVFDFLSEEDKKKIGIDGVTTSFIQKMPFSKRAHRYYIGFMPLAVEQFDLSKYDLIVSSSSAVAKGVITGPKQLHVSYVHSPMRYAWDMQHTYLKEAGLTKGVKSLLARSLLHYLRFWDVRSAYGPDLMLANSRYVARRIRKVYGREAKVVYPPVDTSFFRYEPDKEDYYLTASRMVPYKRIPLIVEAFSRMPDKKLVVIGDGPDFAAAKRLASPNVEFRGAVPSEDLRSAMAKAKAFVFAAEEDFGIVPVEAQACGTPVIAYGAGGALETVRGLDRDQPTGVFFYEQTPDAIEAAVEAFETRAHLFDPLACVRNAEAFSTERFRQNFLDAVRVHVEGERALPPVFSEAQ